MTLTQTERVTQLQNDIDTGLLTPSQVREAKAFLYDLGANGRAAAAPALADENLEGLQRLSESGVPLIGPVPEPADAGVDRMTPAAKALWLERRGLPVKEATYTTTKNGSPVEVNYMGADVHQQAADLLAVIDGEYKGTSSLETQQAQGILNACETGRPLNDAEWQMLQKLEAKYASQLAAFRVRGRDGQNPLDLAPEGSGRVAPPPDTIREANDGLDGADAPLTEAEGLQALANAGFTSMRAGTAMPEPSEPPIDPTELLRSAGVALR